MAHAERDGYAKAGVDYGVIDPGKLLAGLGLDAAGIEQSILKRFGAKLELVLRQAANNG